MLVMHDIIKELTKVYDKYDNVKIGIAGSYANNTATEDSDLDIVLDGDSMRMDIALHIKKLFVITVDVLWVDLMKEEDEELDALALKYGLPINQSSVYKTVMNEVIWV